MEQRLWSLFGSRPETLKAPDLPNVARAIVGYMRGMCKVKAGCTHNTSYVLFKAQGFQVVIRGDDWAKIMPYLQDNTLSPPSEPLVPWFNVSIATVDIHDPDYYSKVLGVLQTLFTETFPTSYL